MKKKISWYGLSGLSLCVSSLLSSAQAKPVSSVADLANNLLFGADFVTDFLHIACLSIGIGFVVYAFIAYRNHRMNPKLVPLDRPIIYCLLGLVLASIPFLNTFLGIETAYAQRQGHSRSTIYNLDAPIDNDD